MINQLPYTAINFASSNLPEGKLRTSAKNLINLLLKQARTESAVQYLNSCLQQRVVPQFVENWFNALPTTSRKGVLRKMKSLKMELIRDAIEQQDLRLHRIQQESGYEYLNVTRKCPEDFVGPFLDLLLRAVRAEEKEIYQRHNNKWSKVTDSDFPVRFYIFEYAPRFPFAFVDRFWAISSGERMTTFAPKRVSEKFINETSISVPQPVTELLEKGPNFRVPHKLDNKFIDQIKLSLDVLTYKLRWSSEMKNAHSHSNHVVPFHKNAVKLPPKMSEEEERELMFLKQEIIKAAETEISQVSKSHNFKKLNKQVAQSKRFCKQNKLCLLYTSPSPRDLSTSRMPSSA